MGSKRGAPALMPHTLPHSSRTLPRLNAVVQAMWVPVLERWVSNLAAEKLQLVLNEVLVKVGNKVRAETSHDQEPAGGQPSERGSQGKGMPA